jgi:hypothetical protein
MTTSLLELMEGRERLLVKEVAAIPDRTSSIMSSDDVLRNSYTPVSNADERLATSNTHADQGSMLIHANALYHGESNSASYKSY